MIKNFKYNNIDVTVDTEKYTISYKDQNYSSLTRVWVCDWVETELNSDSIVVKPKRHHEDNGVIYENSQESFPDLPPRSFTNKNLTITGVGQFDFFAGLTDQPISIEEIFSRALINNQLENLKDVFGEEIPCWNAYFNWEFFNPIETVVQITPYDSEEVQLGLITVKIVNIENAQYTVSVVNNMNDLVILDSVDYIENVNGVFEISNLNQGGYSLVLKSKIDSGQKLINFNI